jgi:erythronate-4-phosphate dehydrogenase
MKLSILADENMPFVDDYFADIGEVKLASGREISPAMLDGTDVLLVRSVTRVDRSLLAGSKVKFVGTATIGTDHIDLDYLEEQGIGFSAAPGCNAQSVVDYVLSSLCALYGDSFISRRFGIIGMGNVGSLLAERLRALGIDFSASDPLLDRGLYTELGSFDQACEADVISLHVPLTMNGDYPTWHMFDEKCLQSLNQGACLINTSRGAVVDNEALCNVLANRPDLEVVLDVWEHEPNINTDLLDRVSIGTPHIAGYSLDGKLRGTDMIYKAVCKYFSVDNTRVINNKQRDLTLDKSAAPVSVLLDCYDVRDDDRALRKVALEPGTAGLANGFDRLRREYPVRREFGGYSVTEKEALPQTTRSLLCALGFNC